MPALPHNIEPSRFHPGSYIGYDGTGHAWRVRKDGTGKWEATPGNSHPGRWTAARITERTLAAVADRLAKRNPNATARRPSVIDIADEPSGGALTNAERDAVLRAALSNPIGRAYVEGGAA
jgi:hypothetical protein